MTIRQRWERVPVGTRSILVGGHQFVIHPLCCMIALRRLEILDRWPRSIPVYVACVIHDWGYWGKHDMDGPEGKAHPEWGARKVSRFFDVPGDGAWFRYVGGHSRSYASRMSMPASALMYADKLATELVPLWLLGLLYWASGEYVEYRDRWMRHDDPPYPGTATDGPWVFARIMKAEWARFRRPGARAGKPIG